ncbi:hypothetical protein ABIC37_005391 [Priestia megaterium]|uniref:hypothetical protein n=1 Tax=Priestia megaterium TaxID=1404 RepID=UPI003392D275
MYRPTVRYSDEYKTYIDQLFHATSLDRNQILRAALFSAAHSHEFKQILLHFKRNDVSLPSPGWKLNDWRFWRYQDIKKIEGGKDVNVNDSGKRSNAENGTPSHVRGGSNTKGAATQESIQGEAARRVRPVAATRGGKDVIRGNGGGITIRIK